MCMNIWKERGKFYIHCKCEDCMNMKKMNIHDPRYKKIINEYYEDRNNPVIYGLGDIIDLFKERVKMHPEFTKDDIKYILREEYRLPEDLDPNDIKFVAKYVDDEDETNFEYCVYDNENYHEKDLFPFKPEQILSASILATKPFNINESSIPFTINTNITNEAAASFDNPSIATESQQQQQSGIDNSVVKFTIDSNSLRMNSSIKCEQATLINAANCLLNQDEFKEIMKGYSKLNGMASFHHVTDEKNFALKIPLVDGKSLNIIPYSKDANIQLI